MHNQTKHITNWEELVTFVESINPYRKTIVLEGWMNEMCGDRLKIKSLIFSTKPVEILTFSDEKILSSGIDIVAKVTTRKNGNNNTKPKK